MTTSTATTGIGGILPDQYGPLIVQPVQAASVAYAVATQLATQSHEFHVPIVKTDAAAAWYAEGQDLNLADGTYGELIATPAKVAGLTAVTRELAMDSNPAAAQIIGDGLARSIAVQVDAAFFGSVAAPAPSGLGALVGVTDVPAGTAWTNVDAFIDAIYAAEAVGAGLTSWVANPADAKLLSKLKQASGSNVPLLQPDPTAATRRAIAGVPLYVSPAVTVGTVWGIPRDRVLVITREDVTLEVDRSVYFASDKVAVKAVMRVAFAFPHPAAVTKIHLSA